jgi:hypothetical protein
VDVTLDQWHLQPGDQLPAFMERAIRENDYILLVCTPCYADRSGRRIGGVGYEGDIMTAVVFTSRYGRKFIPIWRLGADWNTAAPSWLLAKYRIDLRGNPVSEEQYQDWLVTLHGTRPAPPLVVPRRRAPSSSPGIPTTPQPFSFEPVRIWVSSLMTLGLHEWTVLAVAPFTACRFNCGDAPLQNGLKYLFRPGTIL